MSSKEGVVGDDSTVLSLAPVTIAMVAGEVSGDILGAGLIKSLKSRFPNAKFEGIGGPLMLEQGFQSHFPMERLSVMGLVEVLGRIFELLKIRRSIYTRYSTNKPNVFVGIDAPDFNLSLEEKLRSEGVLTAHYVSPTVWAWRQKRVFKIARAVDLMLALLPFEAKFYQSHNVDVRFVGHPLADEVPLVSDKLEARSKLGLGSEQELVAILPGSRGGEIKYIGETFIEAAREIRRRRPNVAFIVPCINLIRRRQIETIINEVGQDLPITLVDGQSRTVMAAADAIMLTSGTAALEAMLVKRPTVVAYRMAKLTYRIMKRLIKVKYVSLPNLLADRELMPELIQDQAQPKSIADYICNQLDQGADNQILDEFHAIHLQLKRDADERSADAVAELVKRSLD